MTNTMRKKAVAILLALAVLVMSFPMLVMQTTAGESYSRVADPSTMDAWKTLFGEEVLSTEDAGTVWTDKSVFTEVSAFDGTGVAITEEDNSFLVALSAIASSVTINGVSVDAMVDDLSFSDSVGSFMNVRDIKGILIGDTLLTGAELSRNFIPGGGDLGSYEQSTVLGDEFVRAIRARLGVDGNTARDLIGLAYREGQIRYADDTDFSNYIGWYANAAGEFLGFWYDGIKTMPDPADPTLTEITRPAYIVRSYFYLGTADDGQGIAQNDLMYAAVQVREHIGTGAQEMLFRIPALCMPTVNYNVALSKSGQPETLDITGAQHPIRLVYEVAPNEDIDAISIHKYIENGDITPQADGSVLLYTNRSADSRFTPSEQNGCYYYTDDCVVYADRNGTPYKGDTLSANAVVYSRFQVYSAKNGLPEQTVFERVLPQALACAVKDADGYWYIPAGTARVPMGQSGEVCVNLRNNGCLTIIPETGMVLKTTAEYADPETRFRLTLTRTDKAETATYKARLIASDGKATSQRVLFEDGVASVVLSADETLSVYGMTAGASYTVTEQPHEQYKLVAINGDSSRTQADMTVEHRRFAHACFENAKKGYGSVTIVKRILHDFGTSFVIPDKQFTVQVTLSEDYANRTIQAEHSGDPSLVSVTTDENASFVITLGHADQLELLRLREGTVVTATELNIPDGFVPTYYGAGIKDAAGVTIQANTAVSILILNRYTYEEVEEIPLTVDGTVELVGRENGEWLDTDVFTVELQRYEDGNWITVDTKIATKDAPRFDFTQTMQAERFTRSGVYSYQVIERIGDTAGIVFDHTMHTFSVTVGDEGMCGHLHILDVTSHHDHTHVGGGEQNGWHIAADFINKYYAGGYAEAVIDIRTDLFNPSESDRVSRANHRFGLFVDGGTTPIVVSDYTDMVGEARLVAPFDKSGEYVYTLKQLIPSAPVAGMTYSDDVYIVTVTVTEDAGGALSADVHITKEDGTVTIPRFINRYLPETATLLPDVKTELSGRDLRENEFTVQIKEGDTLRAEGANDKYGNVVLTVPLEFTAVGDYYYDIAQVRGILGGVTYDPFVYRLHITVTDGGEGALVAHYHVINTAVDIVTFRNSYEVKPVSVVVDGLKRVIGRDLINEEFSFVLVCADRLRGTILSASNYSDGTFRFEPIILREEGVYCYTVHEVFESVAHGIVFDDTVYEVTVTVTDDGCGTLDAQMAVCQNGNAVDRILFVNEYVTKPAEILLSGTVQLGDHTPADGEFTFGLYEADEYWNVEEPIAIVKNDENGRFAFDSLWFDTEGVYYFVVKQQYGGEIRNGITYDGAEYRVQVVVTDNRRGNIFAQWNVFDSNHSVVDTVIFRNATAPDNPIVTTTATSGVASTTSVAKTTAADAAISTTTASATASDNTTLSASATTTTSLGLTTASTTTATQPKTPDTGDIADLTWWFVLLCISGSVFMTFAVSGKKQI